MQEEKWTVCYTTPEGKTFTEIMFSVTDAVGMLIAMARFAGLPGAEMLFRTDVYNELLSCGSFTAHDRLYIKKV